MECDLDVQYSPSYWSKRYSKELVVSKHVEVVSKVSKLVKESIPYETISYGPEETSQVDIYGTTLSKDSPMFVYIHGGYWQELNKNISSYPVLPLVESGIKVFIPGYSLAPKASVADIVEQIKRLGEYVLKEATKSGTRSVWFGGHSAGAHLAASLLDEEWFKQFDKKVQKIFRGLVLISGIYDLVPIVETYVNKPLKLDKSAFKSATRYPLLRPSIHHPVLLNNKEHVLVIGRGLGFLGYFSDRPYDKLAQAIALSPINKDLHWFTVLKHNFTVLLAVAENDSPSFINQTLAYQKVLKMKNINTELINIKGMDHFDIVENLSEKSYLLTISIVEFILKQSFTVQKS